MIDSASISSAHLLPPTLTVVSKSVRLRGQIDRKRNYFIFKRCFDIVFSIAFIVCVLSWLVPLLAILIKLNSRGPVFFVQRRIGRGGRSFTCYKFRTMLLNNEADTLQASENDNRITSLGLFLRKSNIDEFAQFFNVLKGDMSIIGPRPHMYADCKKFSAELPGYKSRNMVKPGLTGLAQVKGYHGPATNRHAIVMRYHWDTYYISQVGWVLEWKIISYTLLQRITVIGKYLLKILQPYKRNTKEAIHNS